MELSPISEKNTTKVNNTDDEMELAHEVCEENSTKMNNPEDEAYFEMLVADIIEDLSKKNVWYYEKHLFRV